MKYRKFGRLDWEASALGFGCMRLPVIEGKPGQIDVLEATRMLHYAIDHGVNYVDTAFGYHEGSSETFLAMALKDGYREKVKIATKMPVWLTNKVSDFDRYLDEQLEKLQVDKIDFYLLHGLNGKRWRCIRDLRVCDWAERAMSDGRIGYLGFSFHDSYEPFCEIVDYYDNWTLAQIQYNYMDVDFQAGIRGLRYAAGKGLAVVVMEPLRGGMLAQKPPDSIQELWQTAPVQRSPVEYALQWVWHHPQVSVVLSGMNSMEQVEENIVSASRSEPNILSKEELDLIDRVRARYQDLSPIPCTGCGYCLPCPNNVDIPSVLKLVVDAFAYDNLSFMQRLYGFIDEKNRADQCIACGSCEEQCPQSIEIINWLEKAHQLLWVEK